MKEILYFPKLNLMFNLSRVAFNLGPFKIYWYGILITIGFILGFSYMSIMSKRFKLTIDSIIDIIIYSVIGGILGARTYYVTFHFDFYKDNLLDVFKIWEGGIAIYGGIIGAFLVGIIICKKRKLPVFQITDLAVGGLILAQSIGRWGNFVNIEAFGKNTNLIFGMTSVSIQNYLFKAASRLANEGVIIDPAANVHPCFLYESFWCLLGFILIMTITLNMNYNIKDNDNKEEKNHRLNIYPGMITLIYFIWYGAGRFVIEGLRVDSLMIGSVRVSKLLSLILVVISILLFFICILKNREKKPMWVEIDNE